jgi:FtsP/CotA-like multicopper oxidase with cupredoxin domain
MFLQMGAATAGASVIPVIPAWGQGARLLQISNRTIEVNRKPARVFSISGPNGALPSIIGREGDRFNATIKNVSDTQVQMHWHGQRGIDANQDRSRPDGGMLGPGQSDQHEFALTPGTHWMHSHTLAEQQLLAAPMVALESDAPDAQDVVVMLHDFAFRSPEEILAELTGARPSADPHAGHNPMPAPSPAISHTAHAAALQHANDVRYDAYLANERTFDDPQIVRVEKGGRVRLRVINGGTATAFFISTPGLSSTCVAVDGTPCRPTFADRYPLAQGQRVDLMVNIPPGGGAFPILAQVEASNAVTGVILAATGSEVRKIDGLAAKTEGYTDLTFEARLSAANPLATKRPDRSFFVMMGELPGYKWTLTTGARGATSPLEARVGERVEITFMNPTGMMHPMHLHGHHFQTVAIGGQRLSGPMRDTIIVPIHTPVTIAFDAEMAGRWFLHCHHLYHMATGMMTELRIS